MATTTGGASIPVPARVSVPWPRVGLIFAHVYVLGFVGVLAGGFMVQFAESEMPCPLCVLQRMAMMLCALGPATIIQRSRSGNVTTQDFAMGYGLAIVAAVAGAAMASRQILLHILPDNPGYGDPVLGLHLYTWAFVIFTVAVLAAGVNLIFAHHVVPGSTAGLGRWSTMVLWALGLIIAANAAVVFVEEGFHWVLPDDPARYELLYQLGLRS